MCRTVTLVLVVAMAMVFVIALSCDVAAEPPAKASPPLDLGFEAGNPGELPAKWFVPTTGWQGELWDEDASDGKRSAKLSPSGNSEIAFGNLMRVVDASEYRGQQVRLSAHIRVEGDGASAMMWLRVDRPGQQMGFFDNMANRPIRSSHWTEAVIEGDVAADAIQLALGVMSLGGGTVFIDDVKLVSSGAASVQAATPARAATARGLENLQAAARLLAYVRFFHPSDEAIAVQDWDRFAVELMEAAEPAENAEQLAEALRRMFAPIAPTLAVWAGGVGDAPRRLPIPADAQYLRYWRHYGAGRVATGQSLYHSQTKQLRLPPQRDETAITATLATWASQELGGKDARSAFESPDLVKDLGGGVSCRLPVMVFVGNNGSLPRGTQENRWAASQPGPRLTALNRSTRLAGVTICWGVMQHFYPYFDVINTDWDAVLPTALAQAAEAADEVAYLHVLQELVGQLHDGHGNVYDSRARSPLALPLAPRLGRRRVGGHGQARIGARTSRGGRRRSFHQWPERRGCVRPTRAADFRGDGGLAAACAQPSLANGGFPGRSLSLATSETGRHRIWDNDGPVFDAGADRKRLGETGERGGAGGGHCLFRFEWRGHGCAGRSLRQAVGCQGDRV